MKYLFSLWTTSALLLFLVGVYGFVVLPSFMVERGDYSQTPLPKDEPLPEVSDDNGALEISINTRYLYTWQQEVQVTLQNFGSEVITLPQSNGCEQSATITLQRDAEIKPDERVCTMMFAEPIVLPSSLSLQVMASLQLPEDAEIGGNYYAVVRYSTFTKLVPVYLYPKDTE
jgi:hypothetical protein